MSSIEQLYQTFSMFDINRDGHISCHELMAVLRQMGIQLSISDCQQLVQRYDRDRNGHMEFNEFVQFVREAEVSQQHYNEPRQVYYI